MSRIILILMVLLDSVVLAGINGGSTLLTMGTLGPDHYADGMTVLDGECYALVWQSRALEQVKFTMDGQVAGGADAAVLRILPLAKDGCCPKTVFAVEPSKLPKLVDRNGRLRLYLLDTRGYGADGRAVPRGAQAVQGSAPVTPLVEVAFAQSVGTDTALEFVASVLGGDVPRPRITHIEVLPTTVVLTVASTVGAVNYTAVDARGEDVAAHPVSGGPEPIKITVPRAPGQKQEFFRVARKSAGER